VAALGAGPAVPISATSGEGMADLYTLLQPHVDATAQRGRRVPPPLLHARWESPKPRAAPAVRQVGEGAPPEARAEGRAEARVEAHAEAYAEANAEAGDMDTQSTTWPSDAGSTFPIQLALLGLPNAGKSTLLNTLLGYERALTGKHGPVCF
jgi:predicted GTPase